MKHHNLDLSSEEFQLFTEGDQRVFRMVFDRYHSRVYRYVQSLTVEQQEIDDIVQKSFIQLFKHKLSIREPAGIYPYLLVTARRMVIMSFRKRVLNVTYQNEAIHTSERRCFNTDNEIDFNELQELLSQNINSLPPKQREIYRLNKLEGYSYGEISSLTGCSINTVRNHLVAASKKVRIQISKHYFTFFAFYLLTY